jgi:alpha-ribazole phosphatase
MTTLLLIRHGQTDWNLQGRYTGQSDIPLNQTGRDQACATAAELERKPPDVIYSSDLIRAQDTARLIAQACHLPVHTDARLREIHQGVWEGMHFDEIKARFAQQFAERQADPLSVAPPGGETVGQVRARVLAAVRDIVQRHPHGRAAIVAHGLALALIKAEATSYPLEKVWDLIPQNCLVEELDFPIDRRYDFPIL